MVVKSHIDERQIYFDGINWKYVDNNRPVERFQETGTLCQNCGKQYMMDLIIPDNLWEKIKPVNKPIGAGLLCPGCICDKLENLFGFSVFHLEKG